MEITPAAPQELVAIAALVNSAYRGDSSRQGWTTEADYLGGQRTSADLLAQSLGPQAWILAAREQGAILGCVFLELRPQAICYLGMLTIAPGLQARGLGRQLLAAAETFARAKGAAKMEMRVIQLRETLLAWYERRGYRLSGKQEPFPYGRMEFGLPQRDDLHFLVMEKELA